MGQLVSDHALPNSDTNHELPGLAFPPTGYICSSTAGCQRRASLCRPVTSGLQSHFADAGQPVTVCNGVNGGVDPGVASHFPPQQPRPARSPDVPGRIPLGGLMRGRSGIALLELWPEPYGVSSRESAALPTGTCEFHWHTGDIGVR